jgi:hypothetical protein
MGGQLMNDDTPFDCPVLLVTCVRADVVQARLCDAS